MKKPRLSKRLETIINQIHCRVLADIGTDHGLTPIAACEQGRADFGIACDISAASLKKAEDYIRENNLSHKIETRLGFGFEPIYPGEADVAVISGMGGMLIRDIVQKSISTVQGINRLILGPQRDLPALRQSLNGMGIIITDEEMLLDGGVFYTILICEPGKSKTLTPEGRLFGQALIDKSDPTLKRFLLELIEKNMRISTKAKNATLEEETRLAKLIIKQKGWFD
jgi:tRNA (adenine22-N1)-methyltransferase